MTQVPIAIVGVSALFPGSTDAQGFWRDILAGARPHHRRAPDALAHRRLLRPRSLGAGQDLRQARGLPPRRGLRPDGVRHPAVHRARHRHRAAPRAHRRAAVLDDATQGQFAKMDRERASVILGVTSGQELLGTMVSRLQRPIWVKALRDSGIPEEEVDVICERIAGGFVPWQESSFPGCSATWWPGASPTASTSAAPTASPTRPARAPSRRSPWPSTSSPRPVRSRHRRRRRHHERHLHVHVLQQDAGALASGDCRPFSDKADGTMLGEGMGMLALKRLDDAERDGDPSTPSSAASAPPTAAQERLRAAARGAGQGAAPRLRGRRLRPDTVELVEAHGTGTKAGDAAEFEGLRDRLRRVAAGPTASGAPSAR
jgi:hypothetical protein